MTSRGSRSAPPSAGDGTDSGTDAATRTDSSDSSDAASEAASAGDAPLLTRASLAAAGHCAPAARTSEGHEIT